MLQRNPEEEVRQKLWHHLTQKLGFPQELIAIEKNLNELSFLVKGKAALAPNRRVDLLCYYKKEEKILPLLLIECKAKTLDKKALFQLEGYNYFIQAPYLALIAQGKVLFRRVGENSPQLAHIPSFEALVKGLMP